MHTTILFQLQSSGIPCRSCESIVSDQTRQSLTGAALSPASCSSFFHTVSCSRMIDAACSLQWNTVRLNSWCGFGRDIDIVSLLVSLNISNANNARHFPRLVRERIPTSPFHKIPSKLNSLSVFFYSFFYLRVNWIIIIDAPHGSLGVFPARAIVFGMATVEQRHCSRMSAGQTGDDSEGVFSAVVVIESTSNCTRRRSAVESFSIALPGPRCKADIRRQGV